MTPASYDLPNQYAGDTFDGFQLTITETLSGITTPIDLGNVTITSKFKQNGAIVLDLSEGSGITIVDAESGIFKLDKFTVPSAGTYQYDIQFVYDSDGSVKTYLRGRMTVIDQIT